MSKNILDLAKAFGVTEAHLTGVTPGTPIARLHEAEHLLAAAWSGNQLARVAVNEALTTSDAFGRTIGDVFDREIRDQFTDLPAQWQKIGTRTTVKDFNPKKLIDLIGGSAVLSKVPEHNNYPEAGYSGLTSTIQVEKFGEAFGYTWEMKLADRLDELKLVPGRWSLKAQRTTDQATLAALANTSTGAPNTALFNAGFKNLYSGAFTAENVQAILTALSQVKDADGQIIAGGALQVVVGPVLRFAAARMFGATEFRSTTASGLTVVEPNPLAGQSWAVMDNLPGDAWFVMPVPATAIRPAIYTAFLVGHESPQVRYKNDQGKLPGGLDLGIDEGSFDDDTCYWRIRHVVGGASGDPTFAVAVTAGSGAGALTKTGW